MKINLSKNQKIIGLVLLAIVIVLVAVLLIYKNKTVNKNTSAPTTVLKPVFLDDKEKTDLNIKPETKVQAIKRNAAGQVMLYKVINNDTDIITNLNQIKPVSATPEK